LLSLGCAYGTFARISLLPPIMFVTIGAYEFSAISACIPKCAEISDACWRIPLDTIVCAAHGLASLPARTLTPLWC
jgi:hypothetical protein